MEWGVVQKPLNPWSRSRGENLSPPGPVPVVQRLLHYFGVSLTRMAEFVIKVGLWDKRDAHLTENPGYGFLDAAITL